MLQLLKRKLLSQRRGVWVCVASGVLVLYLLMSSSSDVPAWNAMFTWRQNQPREPCKLLDLDPHDKAIDKYMKDVPNINCSSWPQPITYIEKSRLFINTTRATESHVVSCHVQYLRRPSSMQFWRRDYDIVYSEATEIRTGNSLLLTEDFVFVECRTDSKEVVYSNYHAHISDARFEAITAKVKANDKYDRQNPSVLILAIESLSRLNFERKYKKTYEVLVNKLKGMVMKGHHKVGDNSIPNVLAMLTGKSFDRDFKEYSPPLREYLRPWSRAYSHLDDFPFIWTDFSQKGYATLLSEDDAKISMLTGPTAGFFREPVDWYMRTFWQALEEHPRNRMGKHSPTHCRGSIPISQLLFTWFYEAISRCHQHSIPLFAFTMVVDITHNDINFPPSFDVDIADFLYSLSTAGYLNNTFLIFMGDHGLRTTDFRTSFFGKIEDRMPLLAIRPPTGFEHKFTSAYESLVANSVKLTSHFDTHETLKAIASGKYRKIAEDPLSPGISLFQDIPRLRLCEEAGVGPHFCTCELGQDVNTTSLSVIQAAQAAVNYINRQIIQGGAGKLCQPLTLDKLSLASIKRPADSKVDLPPGSLAHLTFTTLPSHGIYEATLMMSKARQWEVTDGLSRLDWYSRQVKCMPNSMRPIQKYCYCRDLLKS